MKNRFLIFLLLSFSFLSAQDSIRSGEKEKLLKSIVFLDRSMKDNDEKIVDILCPDVSFGHSNGWVQNFEDFRKDFKSKKVTYKDIQQTELSEIKKYKRTVSIRRKVKVIGTYKNQYFEMNLALLEIWIKKKSVWKLWSRQSVEIKP